MSDWIWHLQNKRLQLTKICIDWNGRNRNRTTGSNNITGSTGSNNRTTGSNNISCIGLSLNLTRTLIWEYELSSERSWTIRAQWLENLRISLNIVLIKYLCCSQMKLIIWIVIDVLCSLWYTCTWWVTSSIPNLNYLIWTLGCVLLLIQVEHLSKIYLLWSLAKTSLG